ncbi:MAG: YHS domain-containing (seleno)protein [Pseudohongiellaceae bacterium]
MRIISTVFCTLVLLMAAPVALAKDPVYTGIFNNLAVSGYDTVAYFTEGEPVRGSRRYEVEWNGATWRFSSAENKALFEAEPERYAPQYGGYCAWAVSEGNTASSEPDLWRIVDGKLYLNYSNSIQRRWEEDIPGNISKADDNWPAVLD